MKKTTLFAMALCAGLPALAQTPAPASLQINKGDSNLTFYGILDAGVARVSHGFSTSDQFSGSVNPQAVKAAQNSVTGVYSGGISPSRLGVKGSMGMANDWKALFNLEAGLNLPTGNLSNGAIGLAQNTAGTASVPAATMSNDSAVSNQLFARSAFFGAASDLYGSITIGLHQSFMLESIGGYDALQGAQLFTPIGFSGAYGGGGATDNSRVDNSVRYKVSVQDFSFGLMHKFGGVSGASNAKSVDELIAGYESGPFGVQAIYQNAKDATSVSNNATATVAYANGLPTYTYTNLGTLKVTYEDTKSYMLLVKYQLDKLGLKAGYQRQEFTNPSNPDTDANTSSIYGQTVSSVNVTPFTIGGASMKKILNVYWLSAGYDLTSKLNLAVGYYHVGQNDYSNGTAASNPGDVSGTSKFESVLVDYHVNKPFDVYAGYMANQVSGGLGAGYVFGANNIFGMGARYKF